MKKDVLNYKLYKNFFSEEEAHLFCQFLDKNEISYLLEDTRNHFDKSIAGRAVQANFLIKIHTNNFKKVNQLIVEDTYKISSESLTKHHLNKLENEELKEILLKPDEWAIEDPPIARLLLKDRGIEISEEDITLLRNNRLKDINEGKDASPFWLILTFLSIIMGIIISMAILIGGIGMGYFYSFGKTTDPDGNKHYVYSESTRIIGKVVFFVGSIILIIEILFLFRNL